MLKSHEIAIVHSELKACKLKDAIFYQLKSETSNGKQFQKNDSNSWIPIWLTARFIFCTALSKAFCFSQKTNFFIRK